MFNVQYDLNGINVNLHKKYNKHQRTKHKEKKGIK